MVSVRQADKRIACEEEFSDSEDEDGGRKDRRDHKKKRQKTDTDDKGDKGMPTINNLYKKVICLAFSSFFDHSSNWPGAVFLCTNNQ